MNEVNLRRDFDTDVVLDYFEAAGAIFFNVGVVKNQSTLTADSRCRGKKFATMVELSTEVLVGE